MTREQLEHQYLVVDNMTFTPRYTYVEIDLEDETKDFDYTITATAEEVYEEWLAQQNSTPIPTLEERTQALEDALLMLL